MKIPKPTAAGKELFLALLPRDPRVTTRLVFGNDAAFVNGNMFFGIYGPDIFVRLPEVHVETLTKIGSRTFEPVPGRAMRGYFTLPRALRTNRAEARSWVAKSFEWASGLPVKKAKR